MHAMRGRTMIAPPTLVAYASFLAGQPVAVRCIANDSASLEQNDGGVMVAYTISQVGDDGIRRFGRNVDGVFEAIPTIYLKAGACKQVVLLLTPGSKLTLPRKVVRGGTTTFFTTAPPAYALEDLVHEAMHIRLDSADEALVECTAYQNGWMAISALHRSPRENRALMAGYRRWHLGSPPDYLADC